MCRCYVQKGKASLEVITRTYTIGQAREALCTFFEAGTVEGWLATFPPDHIFTEGVVGPFVDYINGLY